MIGKRIRNLILTACSITLIGCVQIVTPFSKEIFEKADETRTSIGTFRTVMAGSNGVPPSTFDGRPLAEAMARWENNVKAMQIISNRSAPLIIDCNKLVENLDLSRLYPDLAQTLQGLSRRANAEGSTVPADCQSIVISQTLEGLQEDIKKFKEICGSITTSSNEATVARSRSQSAASQSNVRCLSFFRNSLGSDGGVVPTGLFVRSLTNLETIIEIQKAKQPRSSS